MMTDVFEDGFLPDDGVVFAGDSGTPDEERGEVSDSGEKDTYKENGKKSAAVIDDAEDNPYVPTIGELFGKDREKRREEALRARKMRELYKRSEEYKHDDESKESETPGSASPEGETTAETQNSESQKSESQKSETSGSETQTETPDEAEAEQRKPNYLEMTVQSCVKPLEMRFSQINGAYSKLPIAYRTFTYINSVIEGIIPPERYSYAADETERGIRLSKWNIGEAISAIRRFSEAGRHVDFVTARITPQLVHEVDFYDYIKQLFNENNFEDNEKLCLEFPRTVMYEDEEKVRSAILSMKLLKVKTMLAGAGDRECPITPLFNLPFDFLLLPQWMSALTTDRNKHIAYESFCSFLRDLGCQFICDGIKNDAQISSVSRVDAYGYIPSPAYEGEVEHGRLRMPLDEAVLQEEEEHE